MKTRLWLIPFLLFSIVILAACNRPIPTLEQPTATAIPIASAVSPTPEPTRSEPTQIPTSEPTAEPTTAAEPAVSQDAAAEPTLAPTETAAPAPLPAEDQPARPSTHTICSGENLYRIGLLYNLDWNLLAAANNIPNPNIIYADQELVIPADVQTMSPTLPTTHTVQVGETLYRVGLLYGRPLETIARANSIINPNRIYTGQVLIIPSGEPPPPPPLPATHVAQPRENLYRIGLYYNVPWLAIAQANNILNPNAIYAGMELTIPAIEP